MISRRIARKKSAVQARTPSETVRDLDMPSGGLRVPRRKPALAFRRNPLALLVRIRLPSLRLHALRGAAGDSSDRATHLPRTDFRDPPSSMDGGFVIDSRPPKGLSGVALHAQI